MFKCNQNHGFHITFANGYTISVQWGHNNYCNNKGIQPTDKPSSNAEVAAWDSKNNWVQLPMEDGTEGDDDVQGWCSPEHVATLIQYVKNLPKVE